MDTHTLFTDSLVDFSVKNVDKSALNDNSYNSPTRSTVNNSE